MRFTINMPSIDNRVRINHFLRDYPFELKTLCHSHSFSLFGELNHLVIDFLFGNQLKFNSSFSLDHLNKEKTL